MQATIRFVTDLNVEVHVPVEVGSADPRDVERAVLNAQREYGKRGWTPGEIPAGGYQFPLANEEDFDWSLIGARKGTFTKDGEELDGVWYRNQFYTRRHLAATKKIKSEAVKYSRGAKPTDPPHLVEGDESSSFQYVTLAFFRGGGYKREEYSANAASTPSGGSSRAPSRTNAPAPRASAPKAAPAASKPSALDAMEYNAENMDAVLTFIRECAGQFDEANATVTYNGQTDNLAQFARTNWNSIKSDFDMAVAVAKALEQATGREFEIPVMF